MKFKKFLSVFGLASAAVVTAAAATGATTDTTQYQVDDGDRIRVNIPLYGNDRAVSIRVSAADPENASMRFHAEVQRAFNAKEAQPGTMPEPILINSTEAGTLRFSIPKELLESKSGLWVDVIIAQGRGDVKVDTEHHRIEPKMIGHELDAIKAIINDGGTSAGDLTGERLHNLDFGPGNAGAQGDTTGATIGANLKGATLRSCTWVDGTLTGNAEGVTIIGGKYAHTKFAGRNLKDALFLETNLEGANFSNAELDGAEFRDVNCSRANFHAAHLNNVRVYNSDLSGADLSGAHLVSADLRGANLTDTKLTEAHLEGADMRGLDLSGHASEHLVGAKLDAANIEGLRLPANVRIANGGVLQEA
jgi:uncharacterized protein YjbI with pentapeptide repeats